MQRAHNRPAAPRDDENIQSFALTGLLAPTDVLVLYRPLGTASLLTRDEQGQARLALQEQFTNNELLILLPLLTNYPYFCPYEMLYANFTYGRMNETNVARARKVLYDARDAGVWDSEMRPLRNALSRTRLKLRPLGIEAISMLEVGYMLFPYPAKERPQEDTPS